MTLRTSLLLASLLSAVAACQSATDVGKACAKNEDCSDSLICDFHDGKGTCQEPHGHSAGETAEDTAHGETAHDTAHHVTGGEDTAHGETADDTAHHDTTHHDTMHETGEDTGGQVGDPCTKNEDCSGDLECDMHDGAGTCQEPHDHVGG